MLTAIAEQYPLICRAMRRTYGLSPDHVAAMIMAARYGARAAVWTPYKASRSRRMISDAVGARPRPFTI